MTLEPRTIEQKYERLRMTSIILCIVFVLFSLMTLVYGKVQRSLALKLQEQNIEIESKNRELQEQLKAFAIEAQHARMDAEVQRKLAAENLENCSKSKHK